MTKRLIRIKLDFQGPLHLSRGTESYDQSEEILHSDTLKSALFSSLMELGMEAGESFWDSFRMSSAFPYLGELHFYPKPQSLLPFRLSDEQGHGKEHFRKDLKKISWLEESLLERCLQGNDFELPINSIEGAFACQDKDGAQRLHQQIPYEHELAERVTVSRQPVKDGKQAEPFYFDRWHFAPEAGLHFLITPPEDAQMLQTALRLLGDNGLGADRSVGCGHFHFDPDRHWEEISLQVPDEASSHLALGLYNPSREELEQARLEDSAYRLIRRGGYIASPGRPELLNLRKRSASFMQEGSIISGPAPIGRLLDLRPRSSAEESLPEAARDMHPIWREGRPLFLPFIPYQPA